MRRLPELLSPLRRIEDRYLDGTTLRLRRLEVGDEVVHKLTQKVRLRPGDPTVVSLTNTYLTAEEHAVLAAVPAAVLRKTRGVVAEDPRWVVDRFAGPLDGLLLAEIDLSAERGAVEAADRATGPSRQHDAAPLEEGELVLPDWLGREVTRDERFTGGRLARTSADRLAQLLAAADRPAPGGLAPFVEGRQLRSLPAARDRRWHVLAHLATHTFEPGRDYGERQVTELLGAWCEGGAVDAVALRRYLVEEQLLSRGGGVYRLGSDGPPPSEGERLVRGMGLE